MINFHGNNKSKSYFEGWYFKHQTNNDTICFIPGINIDKNKNKSAFVQVITNNNSYFIDYPFSDFKACKNTLGIKIGNNIFMKKGIKIDIQREDLKIKGEIKYGRFTPIKGDIMGCFKYFPLQCNHGIVSLEHPIKGSLDFNGNTIDLNNAVGYIEKDWGSSFPKSYLWVQCNKFRDNKCDIVISIADVPFMGLKLKGCIAVVRYQNKEYRLATYKGVKILRCDSRGFIIKQGRYCFKAKINQNNSHKVLAPVNGKMSKTINESILCHGEFWFYIDNELLFNLKSDYAAVEFVK